MAEIALHTQQNRAGPLFWSALVSDLCSHLHDPISAPFHSSHCDQRTDLGVSLTFTLIPAVVRTCQCEPPAISGAIVGIRT